MFSLCVKCQCQCRYQIRAKVSNILVCKLEILGQASSACSNEIKYCVRSQGRIISSNYLTSPFSHLREAKLSDLLTAAKDVSSNGKDLSEHSQKSSSDLFKYRDFNISRLQSDNLIRGSLGDIQFLEALGVKSIECCYQTRIRWLLFFLSFSEVNLIDKSINYLLKTKRQLDHKK